jgi:hypothetical protein
MHIEDDCFNWRSTPIPPRPDEAAFQAAMAKQREKEEALGRWYLAKHPEQARRWSQTWWTREDIESIKTVAPDTVAKPNDAGSGKTRIEFLEGGCMLYCLPVIPSRTHE